MYDPVLTFMDRDSLVLEELASICCLSCSKPMKLAVGSKNDIGPRKGIIGILVTCTTEGCSCQGQVHIVDREYVVCPGGSKDTEIIRKIALFEESL